MNEKLTKREVTDSIDEKLYKYLTEHMYCQHRYSRYYNSQIHYVFSQIRDSCVKITDYILQSHEPQGKFRRRSNDIPKELVDKYQYCYGHLIELIIGLFNVYGGDKSCSTE